MRKNYSVFFYSVIFLFFFIVSLRAGAQVIISQYYEGNNTNKWIELTNLGTTTVNTASPQLKLGLWPSSGTSGNIKFSGSATQVVNLNISIPAKGTVLIGNTGNGNEVSYLTAASAVQTSNTVINFDGNDGIALLNSSNSIIDKFGQGINAANISYVRNSNITAPASTFSSSQWTSVSLSSVNTATINSSYRLGYHIIPACLAPVSQPAALVFSNTTINSIGASFTPTAAADEYLVVQSTNASLTATPVDGTNYILGNSFGGGQVVYAGASNSFTAAGLSSGTVYYFFIYSVKSTSCTNGPKYLTSNPLQGNTTTLLPACTSPASQPTGLSFTLVTSNSIDGSFTPSVANEFLVVVSKATTLSAYPVNGIVYNAGDTIGGGTIISRGASISFSTTGLIANTAYYFYVFAINNASCTGGPVYLSTNPLTGNATTLLSPCVSPISQPTILVFSTVSSNAVTASFTPSNSADGYIVITSTNNTLSANPVDGVVYPIGTLLGGGKIVSNSNASAFIANALSSNTTYYFFIYSFNNSTCSGGPKYLTANPLTGNTTTPLPVCVAPAAQPTTLGFSAVSSSSITGSFTAANADEYLVLMSNNSSISANPADGIVYNINDSIGGGKVVQRSANNSFTVQDLSAATSYYFFVFGLNSNCSGGPLYLTASPLTGIQATAAVQSSVLNFYNGNLHAHSSYSDGNSDNTTRIPADDYAFAKNAMCMDFLGISEHNHSGAGMHLADWQPGIAQAATATTSNFVALHGMEWGVIGTQGSAGDHAGHVVVYGIDSLIGWEASNYQIFVQKSLYIGTGGLFDIINRHAGNAFASLAHPDNYDYNNILNTAYDVKADDAIAATAIESGPAFSIDTTYTNPATLGYYAFYKNMLAKGYHIGPTIDHDNHNFTFGHTAKSRLVLLATTLSENSLLDAMRRMRFYASEDCGAKINFTINTQPLGSILRMAGAPAISVNSITTSTVTSIKILYGVPGSGTAPTTVTSATNGTLNYTHTALSNLSTGYYFADITEADGSRIITAPIWYTRDDFAAKHFPVTSFYTINESDRVILKWVTTNEQPGQLFTIERSADGNNFTLLGNIKGRGENDIPVNYVLEDNFPVDGLVYYRLSQKNAAGKINYSEIKVVNRGIKLNNYFTVYPNPVHGVLSVKLFATKNENTTMQIVEMSGRTVMAQPLTLIKGEQSIRLNMTQLSGGMYVLKIKLGSEILTRTVNKL